MPLRAIPGSSEFLVNQNQNISQIARGDKGGSIARVSQDWEMLRPIDGVNAPVPDSAEAQPTPDQVDWQWHAEADLKGSWQGVAPQTADFHPSELNFAMRQSNSDLNLSQAYQADLSQWDPSLGALTGETRHRLQLGAEFKDAQGDAWLALQGGYQSGANASTSLDATIKPLPGVEISSGVSHQAQQDEHREGVKFTTSAWDLPVELTAHQQITRTAASGSRQTQLGIKYGDMNLTQQQTLTSQESGVSTDDSLDWTYSGKPVENLNLNAGWHEQISRFLDLGGSLQSQTRLQRARLSLDLQAGPATGLSLGYTQDTSPDQADPALQRQTEWRLGLNQKLTPAQSLGFNYTATMQLQSYDLHYQYQQQEPELNTESHLNLDWHREKNLGSPELNLERMTAEYATDHLQEQALGFESRLSYASQAGLNTWEGQLRVFGQGKQALPLEMILRRNADQTRQLQFNYSRDF